ncbi:unnamed protein product [Moneuplotes crassus]|uniref:Uncharacterized protein n=1 Tax=Euplotes crassus TaxID=5936 RepID=A0AAD1XKN6_EUPCR|nr:unnamed protein product [Moneuplotes crassus]
MKTGLDDPYMTFYPKAKQSNPRKPRNNFKKRERNSIQEETSSCDPVPMHPRTIRMRNKTTEYPSRQNSVVPTEFHHFERIPKGHNMHPSVQQFNTERKDVNINKKSVKRTNASYNDSKLFEDDELHVPPIKIRSQLKKLMQLKLKGRSKSRDFKYIEADEPVQNSKANALVVLSNRSMLKYPSRSKKNSKRSIKIYNNISDHSLSYRKKHNRSASHSESLTLNGLKASNFPKAIRIPNSRKIIKISSLYQKEPEKSFKMRILSQKLNSWIRVKSKA